MKEITATTETFLKTLEMMYLAGANDNENSTEDEVLTEEELRERIVSHLKVITANLSEASSKDISSEQDDDYGEEV